MTTLHLGMVFVFSKPQLLYMLDLWSLDTEVLNALYENEKENLKERLLKGIAWDDTKDQRLKVAELSAMIYKKLSSRQFSHPAEQNGRSSPPLGGL